MSLTRYVRAARNVAFAAPPLGLSAYAGKKIVDRLVDQSIPAASRDIARGIEAGVKYAMSSRSRSRTGLPVGAMRRPGTFGVKKPKALKSRVRKLEKMAKEELSRVIYKYDNKDTLKPAASQALNGFQDAVSIAQIELALAQSRFFDPVTPGTLVTASLASPTYTQNIGVSVSSICVIRNNYQIPCYVYYGVIRPKTATSVSPTTAWTNGLTDSGNPTNSSYLLKIRDSSEFTDTYKGKIYRKKLMPGQSVSLKNYQKMFDYDPSYFDTNTQTYQPKAKSTMFFFRVHGLLGHDSTVTTEQGVMPCGIDVHVRNTYVVSYNSGGAAVKTIVLNQNASSAFTNGAVSSQLFTDNQAYSIS